THTYVPIIFHAATATEVYTLSLHDALPIFGRARDFDGGDDKVVAPVPVEGLTHWTIALWVKWRDGPNTYEHPIGLGVGHDATFRLEDTTAELKSHDASVSRVLHEGLSWSIA